MKDTPPPPRGKGVLVIPALSIALILLLAASWLIAGDLVARMPALVVAAGRTGTAFVSAEGPMPKALSTRRTSPLMPGCRHQGRACPLRRARMTSNPLIVA